MVDDDKTVFAEGIPNRNPATLQPILTIIEGDNAGEVFQLGDTPLRIGRAEDADIHVNDDRVSRKHAIIRKDRSGRFTIEDLESTNCTFVNYSRISVVVLNPGDVIEIGGAATLKYSEQDPAEEILRRRLIETATKDKLTGVYNRYSFNERLPREFAAAGRSNQPLSLLIWDIDFFKKVNDTYGHPGGDYVLQEVTRVVSRILPLPSGELFFRYGGEEFVILLPRIGLTDATYQAELIRNAVARYHFEFDGRAIQVTVSVGVATYVKSNYGSPEKLLTQADAALYAAKRNGRNRVEASS